MSIPAAFMLQSYELILRFPKFCTKILFRTIRAYPKNSFRVSDLVHRDAETQSILCINEGMRAMSPDHDSLAVVDIQSGLRNLHATT